MNKRYPYLPPEPQKEGGMVAELLGSSPGGDKTVYPSYRPMTIRRTSSHLAPAVSLNSFILGFLIGCAVFYALHSTGSIDICIDCKSSNLPPLPYLPPSLAIVTQPTAASIFHASSRNSSTPTLAASTKSEQPVTMHSSSSNNNICPERPLRLVILILSTPSGSLRRNAIRGTWMHDTPSNLVKLTMKFIVGTQDLIPDQLTPLTKEVNMFHDLLFLPDHKETYSNLTGKVLSSLVWADQSLDFDYLVKADDDSYVRIPPLNSALHKMNCPPDLYWGYFNGQSIPETSGRWAEKHWTICPHYLPYAMGGGYVLSRHLVHIISRYHEQFKLYSNEDVSMGSWLAPFHVTYQHDLRFNTEAASHGCNNNYIISHKEKVRGMYEKYVHLNKNGTFCPEEKEIRPAYIYNWTAESPLNCCERIKGLHIPL